MKIFTSVYHAVKSFFALPTKLINNKSKTKKIEKETSNPSNTLDEFKKNSAQLNEATASSQVNTGNAFKDGEQKEKKERITFNYVVKNDIGQIIKSSFDAGSLSEVKAFLINEGYEVVSIEPRKSMNFNIEIGGAKKLKSGELSFALTQLSTYIKAGIPLIDSVRILAKQTTNPNKRKIYERIVYDLVTGESFSKALENQDTVFPRLLINMVKTSEMTGDLPATLDEMSDYYTSIEKTKKQMISALTYPSVIFVVAIAVVIFCLVYVVPNFVSMYAENNAELPGITQITLAASDFMGKYWLTILITIIVIVVIIAQLYKNIKSFRQALQVFFMKVPVVGKIIIYNEVTMFTKTFASLLNHSVHITDSMDILSRISNNEIFKDIIMNTLNTLSKGGKISESFRGQWAFPIVAYEMLVTGESTGQLGLMMEKVADHYSGLHQNAIASVKSLIEPITIIFLAFTVGFILLSIIIPMFSIYGEIGG